MSASPLMCALLYVLGFIGCAAGFMLCLYSVKHDVRGTRWRWYVDPALGAMFAGFSVFPAINTLVSLGLCLWLARPEGHRLMNWLFSERSSAFKAGHEYATERLVRSNGAEYTAILLDLDEAQDWSLERNPRLDGIQQALDDWRHAFPRNVAKTQETAT